jgi:hypothetical protein
MAKDSRNFKMVIISKESIKMEDLMETEPTTGSKVQLCMREHSKMGLDMEKESGRKVLPNTTDLILKVLNKDTVSCIFLAAIFIKAILSRIKEKDMDRYFGMTVASTRVNGRTGFKMVKVRFICLEDKL